MPELRKIESVANYIPPAGEIVEYLAEENGKVVLKVKKSDGTEQVISGGGGTDTSDATAKPEDVAAGEVFYNADGKQTGTLPDVTAARSGNVVTVPAGRIRTRQTVTVGTAQGAKTYIPGTTDQVIQADTYLSGVQTIKGDANLLPGNIKKGVNILGVTGNLEPGTTFYKCASVDADNKTWTGYKAVLADGVYSFEGNLTTGLAFGDALTPAVDGIYSTDVRVQVAKLYSGNIIPEDGFVFHAPLASDFTDIVGGAVVNDTAGEFEIYQKRSAWKSDNLERTWTLAEPLGTKDGSVFVAVNFVETSGNAYFIRLGNYWDLAMQRYGTMVRFRYGFTGTDSDLFNLADVAVGEWHSFAMTRNPGGFSAYIDGVLITSETGNSVNLASTSLTAGKSGGVNAYMSDLMVYDRELSAEEVKAIHNTVLG